MLECGKEWQEFLRRPEIVGLVKEKVGMVLFMTVVAKENRAPTSADIIPLLLKEVKTLPYELTTEQLLAVAMRIAAATYKANTCMSGAGFCDA